MPKVIKDEFRDLEVSRQRRYQLRKRRDHKCVLCGKPASGSAVYCRKHRKQVNPKVRERQRSYTGAQKRLMGAESYGFE